MFDKCTTMFVIFSTYIIELCPYKKYARGKTILVTFWVPAPRCCRTGCSRCQYRLFMLQEQALYAVFHMASHGLPHASPRDAMWKTAGRHMGDAINLSTLSIAVCPKDITMHIFHTEKMLFQKINRKFHTSAQRCR